MAKISRAAYFDALADIQMCLRANPAGLRLRQLADRMGVPLETLRGRVRQMQQLDLIEIRPGPKRHAGRPGRLYFLKHTPARREREAVGSPPSTRAEETQASPADRIASSCLSSATEEAG